MGIAIYPGSFDPITNGHLDIIKRSSLVFDKIIVAVLINKDKRGLFSIEERVSLIKEAVKDLKNVEVLSFDGLLVDLMEIEESKIIIKGLRNITDFEYEQQMAFLNKKLNNSIETLYMSSSPESAYISSSAVRQIASFNGNIEDFVPVNVYEATKNKFK